MTGDKALYLLVILEFAASGRRGLVNGCQVCSWCAEFSFSRLSVAGRNTFKGADLKTGVLV
jgi:hypothetical protein